MKNIFFAYAWILLTVGIMLTSIAGYYFYLMPKKAVAEGPTEEVILGTAQLADPNLKGVTSIVETKDARATLVATFLERHNSPLQPYSYYGQVFVDLADKHEFDFRLLPAIAMQESNLCKRIPPGSYNCLGFGIHERGTLGFENFDANFARAARELKMYYIDEGLTTPQEIMTKYTPSSNGSWADSVNQWMTEMRYNDRELGRQIDEDNSVLEFVTEEK
jgi:hypothetical protein